MARKSFILNIVDLVAMILTLGAAGALAISYVTPHINPNHIWMLSYFGLLTPILYVVNFILMLYWACRWNPMFFITMLVLLFGLGKVKTFYHLPFSKNYAENQEKGNIKVLTYNVEGFINTDSEGESRSTARDVVDYIKENNPDIICLQEFQSTPKVPRDSIDSWLADWPYKRMGYTIFVKKKGVFGTAIYSKFPILKSGQIDFEESNNGAVWAEVLSGKRDTLRIICNHLETTYVDRSHVALLNYDNFSHETDKKGKIRQIAQRLRKGFGKRAVQADTIARFIASQQIPTVVCGDFNDTPSSYTYRTVRGKYKDTFEEKGSGYGHTYKKIYGLLRIDFILFSDELETISYDSPELPWSDHNPVVATMKFKPADQ